MRTRSFSAPVWNEMIIVSAAGVVGSNGRLVTVDEIKTELQNPNILKGSFTSSVRCTINTRNGIIAFPAGTELNFNLTGGPNPDSIRAIVNYRYQVPGIPGDDSTSGNGRVTIWYERIIAETDVFETNQTYPLNCNLFVSENGMLTSRQPTDDHPAVAICIAPPSPITPTLQLMWT